MLAKKSFTILGGSDVSCRLMVGEGTGQGPQAELELLAKVHPPNPFPAPVFLWRRSQVRRKGRDRKSQNRSPFGQSRGTTS